MPAKTPHERLAYQPTWLAPTPLDRMRVVEMIRRLDPAMRFVGRAYLVATIATVATADHRRSWAILPLAIGTLTNALVGRAVKRSPRAEYIDAIQGMLMIGSIAVAAGLTGGPRSPMVFLLMLGCLIGSSRSTLLGTTLINGSALVILAGTDLAVSPPDGVASVLPLAAFIVTAIAMMIVGRALADAEVESRRASVLDPLTGLLNRAGIEDRFEELRQQAVHTSCSICPVLFDLDHFKAVNDRYGHQLGDAVLRDVASRLTATLRRFELLYRIGGEEFALLLPGLDEADGVEYAERLRSTLSDEPVQGLTITASFGVSAAKGPNLAFANLYRRADQASYEAEGHGRSVCAATALRDTAAA